MTNATDEPEPKEQPMPTGKYILQYHDYEKGQMEMEHFNWWIARAWFLVTKAPRAVTEGRFRLLDVTD